MVIDVTEMTAYAISDEGDAVTLSLVGSDGTPTSLRFQIPDLGNLAITLPSLIEAALRRQLRNTSFRYTYPIGSWTIEQSSDPSFFIVTLKTTDGFGVSFSMSRGSLFQLAQALSDVDEKPARVLAH